MIWRRCSRLGAHGRRDNDPLMLYFELAYIPAEGITEDNARHIDHNLRVLMEMYPQHRVQLNAWDDNGLHSGSQVTKPAALTALCHLIMMAHCIKLFWFSRWYLDLCEHPEGTCRWDVR